MKGLCRAARAASRSRGLPWRALLVALSAACVSTQLEVGASHPAAARAAEPELPSIGRALEPSFEPGASASGTSTASHSAVHRHAAETAAPNAERSGSAAPAPAESAQWTCPMHPEVIRAEPGNCPICGMKLEPVPPQAPPRGSP
jgi:heavy metal-binding protein